MIRNIGIRDLQLVRSIVEDGSLTSAARRMHVTQPAASQRLSQLQDRLGIELFHRMDGRMRATAAGLRLASAAESIAGILAAAETELRDLAEFRSRRLRVTTQCFTCYRWLPFVIGELRSTFPDLTVDVVPDATDDPYQALHDDRVDIAVINHPQHQSGLREFSLFDDELYAVMHDAHPLARQSFVTPANLANETLVLYTGRKHAIVEEVMRPAGKLPMKIIQVRITEAIVELARAGQGIAILSGWSFHDLDNRAGLVPVRITRGGFRRHWRAVVHSDCRDEHITAFVNIVARIGAAMRADTWRSDLQQQSLARRSMVA